MESRYKTCPPPLSLLAVEHTAMIAVVWGLGTRLYKTNVALVEKVVPTGAHPLKLHYKLASYPGHMVHVAWVCG